MKIYSHRFPLNNPPGSSTMYQSFNIILPVVQQCIKASTVHHHSHLINNDKEVAFPKNSTFRIIILQTILIKNEVKKIKSINLTNKKLKILKNNTIIFRAGVQVGCKI